MTLLLQEPALARLVEEPKRLASVELPGTSLLVEVIDFLKDRTHIHTGR